MYTKYQTTIQLPCKLQSYDVREEFIYIYVERIKHMQYKVIEYSYDHYLEYRV